MRRLLTGAVALAAFTTGCSGTGGPTGLATGSSGTVTVSVSAGVTPTFTWTGGAASRLTVTAASGGGASWDLQALDAQAGFAAPVVYGVVPSGAREASADSPLTGGVDYRATITLAAGTQGTLTFRP